MSHETKAKSVLAVVKESEEKQTSTHMVEIATGSIETEVDRLCLCQLLERAYNRLNDRAEKEDKVILSVVQTCESIVISNKPVLCYSLSAHVMSRRDLMAAQMRQTLQGARSS